MKKAFPYILGAVALIALVVLLLGAVGKRNRVMDERITLRLKDKIPYGFYVARQLLPTLFPEAKVYSDRRAPGYWDSLNIRRGNQAVFLVGKIFQANDEELDNLLSFAQNGNYVFIITHTMSYDAMRFFGWGNGNVEVENSFLMNKPDSTSFSLTDTRFAGKKTYHFPGKRYAAYINDKDSSRSVTLCKNEYGYPNFVQFRTGAGYIFIHTAPVAFSNYFILHKDNLRYFENVVSVIPSNVTKVAWNEFYLTKKQNLNEPPPNWLAILFRYESFRWAFITAICALLLYVLLEMRRRQRPIPVIKKPRNESLDFVQTIGRLYYDQRDHRDLARKMSVYFLDHVRNRYKIGTSVLDETFVMALHAKSGYPVEKIQSIIQNIERLDNRDNLSDGSIARFYQELESFYQNT